jgi:hypothetical protein
MVFGKLGLEAVPEKYLREEEPMNPAPRNESSTVANRSQACQRELLRWESWESRSAGETTDMRTERESGGEHRREAAR